MFVFYNFVWSIVDLQCCVSFRCTAKWFKYTYTYIHFLQILFSYKIITDYWTEFPVLNSRSLVPWWLFILHIVICVCVNLRLQIYLFLDVSALVIINLVFFGFCGFFAFNIFILFYLFIFTLQYCIGFALHQHASTTGILFLFCKEIHLYHF